MSYNQPWGSAKIITTACSEDGQPKIESKISALQDRNAMYKKDARGHTRITMYIYPLIHKNILPDCNQINFSSYSTVIVFIVSSITKTMRMNQQLSHCFLFEKCQRHCCRLLVQKTIREPPEKRFFMDRIYRNQIRIENKHWFREPEEEERRAERRKRLGGVPGG